MATTQQPAPTTVTQWRLDPTHSNVEFAVKHMMITTVRGRFNEVDGTVQYDETDQTHSSLEVSIKTARRPRNVELMALARPICIQIQAAVPRCSISIRPPEKLPPAR